jgi:nucleoside transporter
LGDGKVPLDRPLRTERRERFEFCLLFYLQSQAQALWYVPFSNVLAAHGLGHLVKYAFASSSLAAFVSPMIGGALADRHASASRILRWLAFCTGGFLILTFLAISRGWGAGWVLACLQLQQLFYAPAWGLSSAIVLARLPAPERQFGSVRVWGTFGWLLAGPLVSFVLHADLSAKSGFAAAAGWLLLGAFTWLLPSVPPPARKAPQRWTDWLGWDAFCLLRDPNHRPIFISAALFSIPLAAFYPFAVIHLRELGHANPTAAMSLGQVSETIAMYSLGPLLARFRLKTLFLAGIAFGFLRYALFAVDSRAAVLSGIAVHGFCYTFFFITAQIYLERRVDPLFRVRAQTLLTLMMAGFGNLIGSLSCGYWQEWCADANGMHWRLYWAALAACVAGIFVFFALTYRGLGHLHGGSTSNAPPLAVHPADGFPE